MTRIIAGAAGGRRIAAPEGRATRPTSDRVREALFASVLSARGTLAGLRVLDLYAGSGAIGLEALSRGAAHALLVEADRRAAAALRVLDGNQRRNDCQLEGNRQVQIILTTHGLRVTGAQLDAGRLRLGTL